MRSFNGNGRCDLHTHTSASDGMNSPTENVLLAKKKGLSGIAITDHDTVAGIAEALATGREAGIIVVPGIEISTSAGGKDIHVLGYGINPDDALLLERLTQLRATREKRNEMILDKLQALGMPISLQEVIEGLHRPLSPDESIGRPHIADAMVQKGYATDLRDAFDRYLGEGRPAYASLPRIAPEIAMLWIRDAGGAPVIAHPGLYGDDHLVRDIVEKGRPAGIEVYHSDHEPADEVRYMDMVIQYDLIATGGSDYHGIRQGVVFHGDVGSRSVPIETIERLMETTNL